MTRQFYLQNSAHYLGNSMLWWAKQGGYTSDLTQAKIFTRDEAQAQHNQRHEDIPWPVDYIHTRCRLVVDRQDVILRPVRGAGVILHLDPIPPATLISEPIHVVENPVKKSG